MTNLSLKSNTKSIIIIVVVNHNINKKLKDKEMKGQFKDSSLMISWIL